METATEILAAAVGDTTDKTLVIDTDLRAIVIPPTVKNLGVESDDSVLYLHFRCPRMYGRIDLSQFEIRINYKNANGEPDLAEAKEVAVDDEYINFVWEVGDFALAYKGAVRFSVCMKEPNADPERAKHFNTTPATLPVLEGLETAAQVVEKHPDILEGILARLAELESGAGGARAKLRDVTLLAANWQDYTDGQYCQIVEVADATKNSYILPNLNAGQISIMQNKVITFHFENDGGVITAFATGDRPTLDYTIQVIVLEVE